MHAYLQKYKKNGRKLTPDEYVLVHVKDEFDVLI